VDLNPDLCLIRRAQWTPDGSLCAWAVSSMIHSCGLVFGLVVKQFDKKSTVFKSEGPSAAMCDDHGRSDLKLPSVDER
jgi:hypothetical protein